MFTSSLFLFLLYTMCPTHDHTMHYLYLYEICDIYTTRNFEIYIIEAIQCNMLYCTWFCLRRFMPDIYITHSTLYSLFIFYWHVRYCMSWYITAARVCVDYIVQSTLHRVRILHANVQYSCYTGEIACGRHII